MNFRTLLIVFALVLLAAFTLLNWTAFTAPTTLSLGVGQVEGPLGLIMLMVCAFLSVLFLGYIVFQQAAVMVEARRTAKELKAQRELADRAEASRFTELRSYLAGELARLEAQANAATRELGARLGQAETTLRDRIAETERTLAAYVSEVDDKLDSLRLPRPNA